MQVTAGMNAGVDMNGAPLDGATDFLIGGALFPEAEPWEIQLERALQKIEAGATFFQTQAITDIDKFARAAEALRPTAPSSSPASCCSRARASSSSSTSGSPG